MRPLKPQNSAIPKAPKGAGLWALGFGVWGLGFRVQGLGLESFGVWGLGLENLGNSGFSLCCVDRGLVNVIEAG